MECNLVKTPQDLMMLQQMVKEVCRVYDECDLENLFNLQNILSKQQIVYDLHDEQVRALYNICKIYAETNADVVNYACELIKRLYTETPNIKKFLDMLKEYNLLNYKSMTIALFRYWLTADYGYLNAEIIDLIKRTGLMTWLDVHTWCHETDTEDTNEEEKKIYAVLVGSN